MELTARSPMGDYVERERIEIYAPLPHNGVLKELRQGIYYLQGRKENMGVTVTDKSSLCFSCHYGNHIISGKGSSFLQCQKHFENPRYHKYPVLPMVACSGYKVSV